MGKEQILLGIAGIVIGGVIYVKTGLILPALIPFCIGLLFIIFRKEENKIEKRKDK
jgi:hypothetical protein